MSFLYNSDGIEISRFQPAPEGIYNLVIRDTEEKITQHGDPMIAVECEIDDKNEWLGKRVWHNVTFLKPDKDGKPRKGAGMAIDFLKRIGEPWEGQFEVNPVNWVGKTFRAKLKIENDLKSQPRNQIAWLIDDPVPQDGVPF
jgi:hypothetical protein